MKEGWRWPSRLYVNLIHFLWSKFQIFGCEFYPHFVLLIVWIWVSCGWVVLCVGFLVFHSLSCFCTFILLAVPAWITHCSRSCTRRLARTATACFSAARVVSARLWFSVFQAASARSCFSQLDSLAQASLRDFPTPSLLCRVRVRHQVLSSIEVLLSHVNLLVFLTAHFCSCCVWIDGGTRPGIVFGSSDQKTQIFLV
jgi:hypothetical protein